MWVLESISGEAVVKFYLLTGVDHIVGRKNCTIVLSDDNSISRQHSIISVSHPVENTLDPVKLPLVKVKDCSKYGTWVNGDKIGPEYKNLKDGDDVQFGVFQSRFRLVHKPFVVSTSCIGTVERTDLRNEVTKLGGHLLGEFSPNCNYLIMNKVTVTMKVVTALISSRAIVTPDFVKSVRDAIDSKSEIPDPKNFIPPLSNTVVDVEQNNFSVQSERASLFKGMTFIVFNENQFKKLQEAINLAQGKIEIRELIPRFFVDWMADNIYLIQPSKDSLSSFPHYDKLQHTLKRYGKRMLLEAELCLTVIKCRKIDCSVNEIPPTDTSFFIESQVSVTSKQESQIISDSGFIVNANKERPSSIPDSNGQESHISEKSPIESCSYGIDEDFGSNQKCDDIKRPAKRNRCEEEISNAFQDLAVKRLKQDCVTSVAGPSCSILNANVRKRHGSEELFSSPKETKRNKGIVESNNNSTASPKYLTNPGENHMLKSSNERGDTLRSKEPTLEPGSWLNSKPNKYESELSRQKQEDMDSVYGATVVVISRLIPTKSPELISNNSGTSGLKNFKKFKKVWPISRSNTQAVV